MKLARLAPAAAALTLVACSGSGVDTPGAGQGTQALDAPLATATVTRQSITSTVVLKATVTASPAVVITARLAGAYSVDDGRPSVRVGGRSQAVPVTPGVTLTELIARRGSPVLLNYPVATAQVDGFALVAQLAPADLYRLSNVSVDARGQVTAGPGPFDCPLADPVPARGDDDVLTLTCVVPDSVRVFAGMEGVFAIETGRAVGALVLPLEAVAGDADQGMVSVVDDAGRIARRPVSLGLSDGSRVVISAGLAEGDVVTVPGPNLGSSS